MESDGRQRVHTKSIAEDCPGDVLRIFSILPRHTVVFLLRLTFLVVLQLERNPSNLDVLGFTTSQVGDPGATPKCVAILIGMP